MREIDKFKEKANALLFENLKTTTLILCGML